jgi:hypothetical protein
LPTSTGLDNERRTGEGLPSIDVADGGAPHFCAGLGIDGDNRGIEQAIDDLAVRISRSAIHHIATGDSHRTRSGCGW